MEERRKWLEHLIKYVKPHTIVEFGCGSGFVLEILSYHFPDSTIIGVDKSIERLEEVYKKKLKNVVPTKSDFTKTIFPDNTIDTAIFIGSLHEVFSTMGKNRVRDTFILARNALRSNGVLIVQDFLKPSKKSIELSFNNEATRKKFFRFANEFCQRKIEFEEVNDGVRLDIADAVEFISKYRSPTEEDWNEEMHETHFFFTEEEYRDTAQEASFVIQDVIKLSKNEEFWSEIRRDIQCKCEHDYLWINFVLTKI